MVGNECGESFVAEAHIVEGDSPAVTAKRVGSARPAVVKYVSLTTEVIGSG